MLCCECKKEMYLYDVDYNFNGCYDNYWCCDKCNISAFEKVRYGRIVCVEFSKEDKIIRKETYIIKKPVKN